MIRTIARTVPRDPLDGLPDRRRGQAERLAWRLWLGGGKLLLDTRTRAALARDGLEELALREAADDLVRCRLARCRMAGGMEVVEAVVRKYLTS